MPPRRSATDHDRFLKGPLSRSSLSSEQAREDYRSRRTKQGKVSTQPSDSADSSTLPAAVDLKHPGTGFLFKYQRELVDVALELLSGKLPKKAGLMALPTGGGKTRTASWSVLEGLRAELISSVLWTAPTRELLDQAFETFLELWAFSQLLINFE